MPCDLTQQTTALIEHIQTRFHEGHRRALPELLAMAAAAEANGIDAGLVDALRTIGNELEQHMFKEEMRLFPMMTQTGNTLIGRLIQDLHCEHLAHEHAMDEFRTRLRLLGQTHRTDATPCSSVQCQPSPEGSPGRPVHRLFRSSLGVHSRYGPHTRAATDSWHAPTRRLQTFRHLHACPGCFRLKRLPGGACTRWKAPPFHGAHPSATSALLISLP